MLYIQDNSPSNKKRRKGCMNTKEKLTPQQQAERIEGLYKNLERQAHKVFRQDRSGSIDTRKPYFNAEKRFCRFLAENYSLQNLKNVEPCHFYAFAEELQNSICSGNNAFFPGTSILMTKEKNRGS